MFYASVKKYSANKMSKAQERTKKIISYIHSKGITESELKLVSHRQPHSIFGNICKFLNMKNSLKNRFLIYVCVNRNKCFQQIHLNELEQHTQHQDKNLSSQSLIDVTCSENNDGILATSTPICKKNESIDFGNISTIKKSATEKACAVSYFKNCSKKRLFFNDSSESELCSSSSRKAKVDHKTSRSSNNLTSSPPGNLTNSKIEVSILNVSKDEVSIPDVIKNLIKKKEPTSLLPIGTKNSEISLNAIGYSKCLYMEGTFQLQNEELELFKSKQNRKQFYHFVLRRKIFQLVNNTCTLCVKNLRQNLNSMVIYCKCIHPECKVFRVVILNSGKVKVFSTSINFCHIKKRTGQVRSIERRISKTTLRENKALTYRLNKVTEASGMLLKIGNLQDVKSDDVCRKMRSEAMSSLDRDEDDVVDMILMRRSNTGYIQLVADPFQVHVYSREQLDVVKVETKNKKCQPVLHFDSTGSIFKKPKYDSKAPFYYAGVINVSKTNRICPVFEMVSCSHDTASIGLLLIKFKSYVHQNKLKWPLFKHVVTDFSFALLNSICYYWNNMSLEDYINATYQHVIHEDEMSRDVVLLHLCCAHFTKMIINDVNRNSNLSDKRKQELKELLVAAINMNSYDKLKLWFKHISFVLLAKVATPNIKNHLQNLIETCTESKTTNLSEEVYKAPDHTLLKKEMIQYKNSMYYKDFITIYHQVVEEISEYDSNEESPNAYYDPAFLRIILKKYIPYLPLWSDIMSTNCRFSNACVENWHDIVKNFIMDGNKRSKPSRVIRKCREHVLSVYKEIKHDIPKNRLNYDSATYTDMTAEENWKKRKSSKKNFAYHKLFNLNLIKKHEKDSQIGDTEECLYPDKENSKLSRSWGTIEDNNKSSNNQPLLPLYENGLVQDTSYYKQISTIGSYTVAYYNNCILHISDYLSLEDNPTINAIDCCLYAIACQYKPTDISLQKCQVVHSLRQLKISVDYAHTTIYIPIKHGHHYKLLKLVYETQTATLFNGISEDCAAITAINTFQKRFLIKTSQCPKDMNNGLNIINAFAVELEKDLSLFDKKDFVLFLRLLLVRFSNSVESSCLICGFTKHASVEQQWVQCEACFRWIHFTCLPDETDYQKKDLRYKCELCKDYFISKPADELPVTKKQSRDKNSILGILNTQEFSHCQIKQLEQRDFQCLNIWKDETKMWLNNFIIDFSIGCIVKADERYTVLNCNTANIIFRTGAKCLEEAEMLTKAEINCIPILKNTIIMPFNRSEHWCLCIADINNRTFTYIDPMGESYRTSKTYLTYFIDTVIKYNNENPKFKVATDKWRIVKVPHVKQKDKYNCGIYVVMFTECIVKNQELFPTMQANQYRLYLKDLLLSYCK